MSNVRPWFRLSSIARPTSQGSSDSPPPLPQPRQTPSRPVLVRSPTKQPSPPRQQQPPSPPRQPPSPLRQQTPPPPQERSPYHSPPSRHTSPRTPAKTKSPFSTPPQSPTEVQETLPPQKPTSPAKSFRKAPPPRVLSPYALPPSQLHSERETIQKNIVTTEKTNQVHEPNHHNQNHNHQGNSIKKTHHRPSFLGSKNIMGTRVITIAGENKGAVMEILQSPLSNKSYKTGGEGTHSSRIFNSAGEKERRLQSSSSKASDKEKGE
ncbi:hypothetical protein Bca4012_018392 [Brassica carinata]